MDKPIQDFQEYALIYWPAHCSMNGERVNRVAGLDNILRFPVLRDPNHQFPNWIAGVRKLLSQWQFCFYGERVENELEKYISEPPSPYLISCIYGFTDIVAYYNQPSNETGWSGRASSSGNQEESSEVPAETDPTMVKIQGLSDVHLTCMFGRLGTLQKLAKLKPSDKAFLN